MSDQEKIETLQKRVTELESILEHTDDVIDVAAYICAVYESHSPVECLEDYIQPLSILGKKMRELKESK